MQQEESEMEIKDSLHAKRQGLAHQRTASFKH